MGSLLGYNLGVCSCSLVDSGYISYPSTDRPTHPPTQTGASGVLSWERYLVVHPHYKPRHLTRALVHGYIFLVFSLPFLTSWVYLLIAKLQHTDQMTLDRPEDPASFTLLLATLLVFLGMPGRVFFDLMYVRVV